MNKLTIFTRIKEWLAYLPVRTAFRIIWVTAKMGGHSARNVHLAMHDAWLDVPEATWKKS